MEGAIMNNFAIRRMGLTFLGLAALLWPGGPGVSKVCAHAVVIAASPEDGAILEKAPAEIVLRFNALIEISLSRVTLATFEGKSIPLPEGWQHRQERTTSNQLVVPLPPLGPGRYVLHFKVLATDGHATPGVLRFTVAADSGSP
jgi:methionine-rich copper-binding protein CopC